MTDLIPVEDLLAGTLTSTPRDIDWQEALGENLDGWRFWQAFDYEVNGKDVTLIAAGIGGDAVAAFYNGERIDLDDSDSIEDYGRQADLHCQHCQAWVENSGAEWVDENSEVDCPSDQAPDGVHTVDRLTEDELSDLQSVEAQSAEGPMMNYWYPLGESDPSSLGSYKNHYDAVEAAYRLRNTALCLVEVDGEVGLALTGGGMDLTWEIVEAFTLLGYLPPLHFCSLPGMSGRGPGTRLKSGHRIVWREDDSIAVLHDEREVATYPPGSRRTAEQDFSEHHPASERDAYIIAAVERAFEFEIESLQYRLKHHREQFKLPADKA